MTVYKNIDPRISGYSATPRILHVNTTTATMRTGVHVTAKLGQVWGESGITFLPHRPEATIRAMSHIGNYVLI